MREIEYRAWNIDHAIMHKVGDDWGTTHPYDCLIYRKEGQPVIVLEYTGLKDKNGKKIFEGDILKIKHGQIGICEFTTFGHKNSCGFVIRAPGDDKGIYFNSDIPHFKIIGNIYENSKLLERENLPALIKRNKIKPGKNYSMIIGKNEMP